MKQLLLLFCFLMSLAAAAADAPRPRRWDAALEHAAPAAPDSVQLRASHYTRYLTDALRLSNRQALAVCRCALLPAAAPAAAPAWQQFDQALLRILTPGQYCSFSRLADTMLP